MATHWCRSESHGRKPLCGRHAGEHAQRGHDVYALASRPLRSKPVRRAPE